MATANPTAPRAATPAATRQTRIEKGMSLARGPALVLGTILLAAGLYFLYRAHSFPRFSNVPNGTAHKDGTFFLGLFGANGWTGMFTAVCGGLLLFGAAQHLLAKTMSLIVGLALGAAAIISGVSGDVLGMAAANGWTELGWAVCAVILLFNTLLPRRQRTVVVEDPAVTRRGYGEPATAAMAAPPGAAATREPVADRNDPMADRDEAVADRDEPAAGSDEAAAQHEAAVDREGAEPPTTPLRRG